MELGDAIERRIAEFHRGVPDDEQARSPRSALQRIVGSSRRDPFGRQVAALEALYVEAAEREGLAGITGKWRPMFPIVGYPQQMGDVLIGRTLLEVKCVEVRPAVARLHRHDSAGVGISERQDERVSPQLTEYLPRQAWRISAVDAAAAAPSAVWSTTDE